MAEGTRTDSERNEADSRRTGDDPDAERRFGRDPAVDERQAPDDLTDLPKESASSATTTSPTGPPR